MILSYMLQLSAVLLLSIAMPKHFKEYSARPLSPLTNLGVRCLGWLALMASAVVPFSADLPAIAIVEWCCLLSVNIVVVALVHSRQRKAKVSR